MRGDEWITDVNNCTRQELLLADGFGDCIHGGDCSSSADSLKGIGRDFWWLICWYNFKDGMGD